MDVVKIPAKLRKALQTIRSGQVEAGLAQLATIKGFEPQKASAEAEVAYFQGNFAAAMHFDEQALPFDGQWYASNVLTEHLFAYSRAALLSGNEARAQQFLQQLLAKKEALLLPDHSLHFYRYQVAQHLQRLGGASGHLPSAPQPLLPLATGAPLETFVPQLRQYRPKLTFDSASGADYLLHFMFGAAATAEVLHYYRIYAHELRTESHHLNAARLYAQLGDRAAAEKALLTYAAIAWFPVEHTQVVPMRLWEFTELFPILTTELTTQLLLLPKVP
jgi:tetratricopeptide (TPR) repeat protein